MEYKNLDRLASYEAFSHLAPASQKGGPEASRIKKCVVDAGGGLSYSWAAMPVADEHIAVFKTMASEAALVEKYKALLSGERINTGENRLVLHQLTRGALLKEPVVADGEDKGEFYKGELAKIKAFSEDLRSGKIKGSTGKAFDTVCQIGIGGSDLGPRALAIALEGLYPESPVKAVFVSNVDPDDAAAAVASLDPETTLFVLVSKSGTTLETLTNQLFVADLIRKKCPAINVPEHFVAVTSKTSPLAKSSEVRAAFFIDDYIGGRYSSTSAVGGVILSCAFGYDVFEGVIKGAHEADMNALNENVTDNAALLDAFIGVYLRNVMGYPSTAILPYSQALSRFPAHLQQLDMESNGKHVNRFKEPVSYPTGPVIFGEPGTNGQHSFYQLLHQGTDIVPLQFIGFAENQRGKDLVVQGSDGQTKLNANLVAQIVAFARGKDDQDPNKRFCGERPSSLLFAKKLTPRVLGALLAHYENKVMFQGFIWNLNSFDQEGVQLGKVLAKKVLAGCEGDESLLAYCELLSK